MNTPKGQSKAASGSSLLFACSAGARQCEFCVPTIPCLLQYMRNSEEAPGPKIPYLCCCKGLIPSNITSTLHKATEPCEECCRQQLLVLLLHLLLLAAVSLVF